MHLIASIPGGWNPNDEGVLHIQQTPGDIIFLSAGDTEINTVNSAYKKLQTEVGEAIPSIRLASLLSFKQELTIDTYIDEVVKHAKVIVCRMLGGKNYYSYLFDALREVCQEKKIPLIFLPGQNTPDMELFSASTVPFEVADKIWKYLVAGGLGNCVNCLKYICTSLLGYQYAVKEIKNIPDIFLYNKEKGIISQEEQEKVSVNQWPNVLLLAYKTHYLASNLQPIDLLIDKLKSRKLNPITVFVQSLREENHPDELIQFLTNFGTRNIDLVINTTGFSIKQLTETEETPFLFSRLNVPVIQAIFASCTKEIWENSSFGLLPVDIAMNIALPEVDGRIISTAVSFKSLVNKDSITDSDIIRYAAHEEGCELVSDMTYNWIKLQHKPNQEKHIALILPNYPNKDSRLANGVGLDTPESCVEILKALQIQGYYVGDIPDNGTALIDALTQTVTNDLDSFDIRESNILLAETDFYKHYNALSEELRRKVEAQWGHPEESPNFIDGNFLIPGLLSGNIFISIQPSRGYNQDPQAIYHSPDLAPTYAYLAFYFWLQEVYKADAIVHVGKHGNLEWLPGKSVALSKGSCFPSFLKPIPHFYPFIVNDPGEGTQAKRRTHAVILDHLIPPMTRAELYGNLTKLEHLVDEYYEASNMDNKRTKSLKEQIKKLVSETNLQQDLNLPKDDINELLLRLDGYLCELKEAQIRDGLHIFGKSPEGTQLADLLVALHRLPSGSMPGITQALSQDLALHFNPLNCDYAAPLNQEINAVACRTVGDAIEQLEAMAQGHLLQAITGENISEYIAQYPVYTQVMETLLDKTLPKIRQTSNEISHLLAGLQGNYVPSGPSGAPTRGRLDVLPTGRNFYSVDVRTIPTETAYRLGTKSAALLIDKYLQEHGDYPESIGISVWGTSTMRTGGDDIAQAFALIGVKPLWQGSNRRVADFEIIPMFLLKRPRIDVTLRISGFFRDAFPEVINLFNAAVEKVALLDEPLEENPIRKRYLEEKQDWLKKGLDNSQAEQRSLYRVFGSKPGAYGAGLQAVIDERNWTSADDLADIYINWSGYAYGKGAEGKSAHEVYKKRLSTINVVLHNQDNREHDILDSDDYYQFQGGMANAVRSITGENPEIYFGDHSRPENPRVKTLKEELLKVYRSRVINPKWIDGVKRHGYKGAFEMAATLDYLFAYDATTGLVDDFMYEGIAEAYLIDPETRKFIEQNNPWALKDMSERMLEAIQRNMWQAPKEETVEKLKSIYLESEGILEER